MPYYSWKSANKLWREKGEEATKDERERERKESVSDPAIHQAYIYPLLYVSPIDTNSCGEKKERILFLSFRPSAAVHGNPAWHWFSPIFLRLHSFSQSSDRRRCCTPFTQIRVFIYLRDALCSALCYPADTSPRAAAKVKPMPTRERGDNPRQQGKNWRRRRRSIPGREREWKGRQKNFLVSVVAVVAVCTPMWK